MTISGVPEGVDEGVDTGAGEGVGEGVDAGAGAGVDTGANTGAGEPDEPRVTVYWRPGCPFCVSLRRGLQRSGLTTEQVDIWADPSGAAFVRSHAGGNETVPTVDIAGTVLVNPRAGLVIELAAAAGIAITPPERRWWQRT